MLKLVRRRQAGGPENEQRDGAPSERKRSSDSDGRKVPVMTLRLSSTSSGSLE